MEGKANESYSFIRETGPGILASLAATSLVFSAWDAFSAPTLTTKSLEGVWKVTKVVKTGPNAGTDSHPQPSLAIYSRGYYSILRDNAAEPRKPATVKDPQKPTDAEKIAKYDEWSPYAASGGTYEVKGRSFITHNLVAKQAGAMTATEEATVLKFTGDILVLSPKPITGAPPGEVVERTYTRIR